MVGRTVVDVDDLEAAALVEMFHQFANQRSDICCLVAHGNNDRDCRRGLARGAFSHPLPFRGAVRIVRDAVAAMSSRTTLLRRAKEGPGIGVIGGSGLAVNASRRDANQPRIRSAPTVPAIAPASTSLGKCAVTITRLTAITTA